jgi:Podovirus DNA encapsidation protein (Gp16).
MAIRWKNIFKTFGNNKPGKIKEQQQVNQYYDINPIDNTGAIYRVIIGQRSNGKTYSVCKHIIEDYFKEGKRGAYIRRYEESITPKNLQSLFNPHLKLIWELSEHKWNSIFTGLKNFILCHR